MKIKDILSRKGGAVVTIGPDRSVQDAIRRLCEHRIGALVVRGEDGQLAGIVTERDIMMDCGYQCSQLEKLANPGKARCPRRVEDVMTRDVVVGDPDDGLQDALGVMSEHRIRHLPIVSRGHMVGIVSIGDVVDAHLARTAHENRDLKHYIRGTAQ